KSDNDNEDLVSSAEYIYHANQLDWKNGVTEWMLTFLMSLLNGLLGYCQLLMNIQTELTIPEALYVADTLVFEGLYYIALNKFQESNESITKALSLYDSFLTSSETDTG